MGRETSTYVIPEWVEIRKITTKADYRAFRRLYQDAFGMSYKRMFLSFLLTVKHSYVWLYKGEYIGIYSLIEEESLRVAPGAQFRVLYNFAIVSNMRGKGFSRVLLADAITKADKLGYKELLLKVRLSNKTALNLYEKSNFKFMYDTNN